MAHLWGGDCGAVRAVGRDVGEERAGRILGPDVMPVVTPAEIATTHTALLSEMLSEILSGILGQGDRMYGKSQSSPDTASTR